MPTVEEERRDDRLARYRRIEEKRKRPLVVYATSTRYGVNAPISGDVIREFIDQFSAIDGDALDILIHSYGGDPLAAWSVMSIARERFKWVGVLVPFSAFSAATIIALGADEIVMHPRASLGPIDPQVTTSAPDGYRQFAYEDVGALFQFLRKDVGITDQAELGRVLDRLFSEADPLILGMAHRASQLSSEVGERLLSMHMGPEERRKAREIAQNLNRSFFSHGDAVSRTRARDLELKVAADDPFLEALLWDAYLAVEERMELREPFYHLSHYMADTAARQSLIPPAAVALPPDSPEELVKAVWNAAAARAVGRLQAGAPEVPFRLVHVLLESVRLTAEQFSEGSLLGFRRPTGEISVTANVTAVRWDRTVVAKKEDVSDGKPKTEED